MQLHVRNTRRDFGTPTPPAGPRQDPRGQSHKALQVVTDHRGGAGQGVGMQVTRWGEAVSGLGPLPEGGTLIVPV